ncbi:MAG: alpha-mannosidase, partial [Candidatus Baldrarchaeia archaeon]
MKPKVFIVGHSHIDAAWLWRKNETIEICKNTFNIVLNLMKSYPELKFVQSSAQYYNWIESLNPKLYEKIKKKVEEGKWEPAVPWVEFDANLCHGESIVRQLVYSKFYFKDKFGFDAKVLWLPDTFGFSNTLPQLMVGADVKYFFTQKLRWNDTVKFPYNYFIWESPDGSKVLAHQSFGDLGGTISEADVQKMISKCRRRHGFEVVYVLIGYGDHGGGLGKEILETCRKFLKNPSYDSWFACPTELFEHIEKISAKKPLPVWRDELYLQFHRGAYTTQSKIKRLIRKAECLMIEAEKMASIASWYDFKYPDRKIENLWRKLLFNQFHDIIAGTSIAEVCIDAEKELNEVISEAREIILEATNYLTSKLNLTSDKLVVFNTLFWERKAKIFLENDPKYREKLRLYQEVKENGEVKLLLPTITLPPLSYVSYNLDDEKFSSIEDPVTLKEENNRIVMENKMLRCVISRETGAIIKLYLKDMNMNLIDEGRGGIHIQIFRDEPVKGRVGGESGFDASIFDAWETYIFQQPRGVDFSPLLKPVSLEVVEKGPLRASVKLIYEYEQDGRPKSIFQLKYSLYSNIDWVEVALKADWHAKHRMAKFFIPVSFYSEYVKFDQPYGWTKRKNPFSENASQYEKAKFEVPGIMWADISKEDGEGLSVIDNGIYGYDFGGDFVRLSLLRSAKYPPHFGESWDSEQPITDQGEHRFKLALYPHGSGWKLIETVRRAYEFHFNPIVIFEPVHSGMLPEKGNF